MRPHGCHRFLTHHVALSVVGTGRLLESGYFRAKQVQEDLIRASDVPYSIVHATQFFEFAKGLADGMTEVDTVRLPDARIQPMVSDDVAAAVGRTAVGDPVGGVVETGGPEAFRLEEFIRMGLAAQNDPREIVTDSQARYWGAELREDTLLPGPDAHLAETRFADWPARRK